MVQLKLNQYQLENGLAPIRRQAITWILIDSDF